MNEYRIGELRHALLRTSIYLFGGVCIGTVMGGGWLVFVTSIIVCFLLLTLLYLIFLRVIQS